MSCTCSELDMGDGSGHVPGCPLYAILPVNQPPFRGQEIPWMREAALEIVQRAATTFLERDVDISGLSLEVPISNIIEKHAPRVETGAHPSQDARHEAENAYTISAFDYERDPVGSRDWTLFWKGWQAARSTPSLPAQDAEIYLCPDGCGCTWRDNRDGSMSLAGPNSKSCKVCEWLPLKKLIPLWRGPAPVPQEKCEKCGKPKMSTVPDPAMTCYLVWHFCFCEEMANDAPKNEGPPCDNCSKPSRYHFCWQDDSHKYHPSELRGGSTPSPDPPQNLNQQLETVRLSKDLFKSKFESANIEIERLREALREALEKLREVHNGADTCADELCEGCKFVREAERKNCQHPVLYSGPDSGGKTVCSSCGSPDVAQMAGTQERPE